MGHFRFSMSIHELLRSYQQQFCAGQKPNIHIFETVVYKQEVMYSIVIHAPRAHKLLSKYPLLEDTQDAVCGFHENTIIWRPQAMSKTQGYLQKPEKTTCGITSEWHSMLHMEKSSSSARKFWLSVSNSVREPSQNLTQKSL